MSFTELTIENCNHRFCVDDKYTSTCRICGEKNYRYENFGVKVVKGLFDMNPEVVKDVTDTINYLHDNALIYFAEWYLFTQKESDVFLNFSDEEKLKLFRDEQQTKLTINRIKDLTTEINISINSIISKDLPF